MAGRIPASVGTRTLVAIILTGTLSVLDSTVVVPLLSTIGQEFGGESEISWLVAAYLVASTVTIPLWGRWLDLRGERDVMWWALSVFSAGTVLAVFSPSLGVLIAARVVQGIGAGGLVPVGQAILASRCSADERARLQIYYNIAYGAAAGLGPLVGGALVGISWRWAFVLLLPFAALAGVMLLGKLRNHPPGVELKPFDILGSVLMTVGLVLVLLGIERGWWWILGVGVAVLVVFVLHSRRSPDGLVPPSVLGNRVIIACSLMAVIIGFGQFAMLTFLPQLSQEAAPGLNSGLVVLPLTLLWMTLGAVTGIVALRIGTRRLAIASVVFAALAGAAVALSAQLPALLVASTLMGASAGLILIPALLLGQHSARRGEVGAATSLMVLTRNFGGALGAAVTAVLISDVGVSEAFWLVAALCAVALLPALSLPGLPRERALIAAARA